MTSIMSVNRATMDVVRPSSPSRAPTEAATTNADATSKPQAPASKEELNGVVKELNDYVQSINRNLEFSVDEGTERTVIRVVDTATGELVRQIPSEEVLQVARHLRDMEQMAEGTFFKAQV